MSCCKVWIYWVYKIYNRLSCRNNFTFTSHHMYIIEYLICYLIFFCCRSICFVLLLICCWLLYFIVCLIVLNKFHWIIQKDQKQVWKMATYWFLYIVWSTNLRNTRIILYTYKVKFFLCVFPRIIKSI